MRCGMCCDWICDVACLVFLIPFHQRRRAAARSSFMLDGLQAPLVGFGDLSVIKAAELDGVSIPWRVAEPATAAAANYGFDTAASDADLAALMALMEQCMDSDPRKRPTLDALQVIRG